MSAPQPNSLIEKARSGAFAYESTLEPTKRKRLGQFFTGLPLSRLLAAIALEVEANTVIDPMAGHGDLLDAAVERAARQCRRLECLEGVEIDPLTADVCRQRLENWHSLVASLHIRAGDAFSAAASREYLTEGYAVVITNPPYVRYQTLATQDGSVAQLSPDRIRAELGEVVRRRVATDEWPLWRTLIDNYSGLADLSVPAWILSAALVRPGGVLALVAPATWRSRDYGEVIEYLLARCFRVKYLIEDAQPGWFSEALVRTQLVIAERLGTAETSIPISERQPTADTVLRVKVSPQACRGEHLVGAAFPEGDSEGAFGMWLGETANDDQTHQKLGLTRQRDPLTDFIEGAIASAGRRSWFGGIEPSNPAGSLFETFRRSSPNIVPAPVRPLFHGLAPCNLVLPEAAGLSIGQGLRTGCNGFFYVDWLGEAGAGSARIRLSHLFDDQELTVPVACLAPVVRRQSELSGPVNAARLPGRVLDLRQWVLPEDAAIVAQAKHLYDREGLAVPTVMPLELAEFVRRAGNTLVRTNGNESKPVSELSAVRTNVRASGNRIPRFWYMLPSFAPRHLPLAFVARINQGVPWIEVNDEPPALIDANFSTICGDSRWTRFALRALFNSSWARVCMEVLGTPLGGGALKLEATQLNRLPIPVMDSSDLAILDDEGRRLESATTSGAERLHRFILTKITRSEEANAKFDIVLRDLQHTAESLCRDRQRKRT
jgi:hypothetical protein